MMYILKAVGADHPVHSGNSQVPKQAGPAAHIHWKSGIIDAPFRLLSPVYPQYGQSMLCF